MRIYISAGRAKAVEAESLARLLTDLGHEVPVEWWTEALGEDDSDVSADDAIDLAEVMLVAVHQSDALIYLAGPRGAQHGAAVEYGMALSIGCYVLGVGTPGVTVFDHLASWVDDLDAAVTWVEERRAIVDGAS